MPTNTEIAERAAREICKWAETFVTPKMFSQCHAIILRAIEESQVQQEPSALSEYEQQSAGFANYALEVKKLLTEEFGEHFPADVPAVTEILEQTEDFLKRGKFRGGDATREGVSVNVAEDQSKLRGK